MSKDISVAKLVDVVPYNSLQVVDVAGIKTLAIGGDNELSRAVDVVINGIESPSVVATSAVQIMAQIPSILNGQTISSIEVRTERTTLTKTARMVFSLEEPGVVEGVQRLVQKFSLCLLRDYEPRVMGGTETASGGLHSLVGTNFDREKLTSEISGRVSSVTETIIRTQKTFGDQTEMLQDAQITAISFNESNGSVDVSIQLTNQVGQTAEFAAEF